MTLTDVRLNERPFEMDPPSLEKQPLKDIWDNLERKYDFGEIVQDC